MHRDNFQGYPMISSIDIVFLISNHETKGPIQYTVQNSAAVTFLSKLMHNEFHGKAFNVPH